MSGPLHEALALEGGIVAAVGAGGKKTALYRIAGESGARYALTATVFSAPPGRRLWDRRVLATGDALYEGVRMLHGIRRVAYAGPSDKPGRIAGVPPDTITRLHRDCGFDLTLVKADGARMRGLKAPRAGEPVLPPETALAIHLSSAAVLGARLDDDSAHRLEEIGRVTGLAPGDIVEPRHLAALLASEQGAGQGVGGARLVAIINQVDDPARLDAAREAAQQALATPSRLSRVVLCSLRAARPVVEVLDRARP